MNIPVLLQAARRSRSARLKLDLMLPFAIPFNRPHGYRVRPLPEGGIRVHIPYWRVNFNHIRGIHACALATAAEMCSGLSVLEHLDPRQYRLIMRSLHMDYHFQAKRAAFAECRPDGAVIREQVVEPLRTDDRVEYQSTVEVHDVDGHHLATGTIVWQVKPWANVRTAR
ncbi:MAG: DUF4442 domain-containing protein [Flavobacteriales bacterium]|nr:DUF4442 domain-containing protein [Flavobacteriales bacterium]